MTKFQTQIFDLFCVFATPKMSNFSHAELLDVFDSSLSSDSEEVEAVALAVTCLMFEEWLELYQEPQGQSRAIHIPQVRINFETYDDETVKFEFRFSKEQIRELVDLLEIPDPFITSQNRYNSSAIEILLILLAQLSTQTD